MSATTTGRVADYVPAPDRDPLRPHEPRPVLLIELPPADYPAVVVIGHALEGLDGYDGATRADLAALPAMPGGWRIVRDPADPLRPARELLAACTPGKTITRDETGTLRITDGNPTEE